MSWPTNDDKNKQLFEILVGAAWIDGEIQPEEKEYLYKIGKQQGLTEETEIQELLSNSNGMSPAKCYQLLENYLGNSPKPEDYHHLLSAISTLVYSDGDIATEEAQLLNQLQELEPNNPPLNSVFDKVLSQIRKLYQKSLASI